jgi:DNA repair photolyase
MAPVLPCLTDRDDQIEATVRAIAEAGTGWVSPTVLRLPTGAREWWWQWLERERPDLIPAYRKLYGRGARVDRSYETALYERVWRAAERHGLGREPPGRSGHERRDGRSASRSRPDTWPTAVAGSPGGGVPEQLTLG